MKTKNTFYIICFSVIACIAFLFTSCSTSNSLSSGNPRYHLYLVKTGLHNPAIIQKRNVENTAIAPMPQHSPFVAYNSDNQLNTTFKSEMKQVKKSNPSVYNVIKKLIINSSSGQWAVIGSKSIINNKSSNNISNDGEGFHHHGYLGLCILFLLLSLLFYILAFGIGIFYIFGLICSIAAIIFFILWIINLAS